VDRRMFVVGVLAAGLLGLGSPAAALEPVSKGEDGLALGGHDAVAYFTSKPSGTARPGSSPARSIARPS